MRDITLGETFYHFFTTRASATGVPSTLGGSPVLSVLEENNATPITAGVSVQVDRASVTGLNQATIVASGANGYEAGKSYALYVSTGTINGVSVVGEVVGEFTVQASAACVRIGAAGAGLTALGDARIANLDAAISSRSTYAGGAVSSVTADVGITQAGADKVWGSATRTLTSFGTLVADAAAAVWSAATRLLTAGTNIVLAKGVGVTGLNDIAATDIVSAGAITTSAGKVSGVILTDTTTTLTGAPADSSGTTTLLARLTALRAGYLDNLSAGAAALEASMTTVLTKLLKYVQLIVRKDVAIGADNATEKTAINANGGSGAGTYDQTTDSLEANRDNIGTAGAGLSSSDDAVLTAISQLNPSAVTIISPVSASGDVTIIRGDSYALSDATQIDWVRAGWINLTGVTLVNIGIKPYGSDTVTVFVGSAPVTGTGSQTIRLELTAAQSAVLENGAYDIQVALAGKIHTLLIGKWIVTQDVTP